jgi:hypothetical protein
MKLESFCTTKEIVSILKRSPTEWKKMFPALLAILGHKGNANQNHTKIPPHSC